MANECMEDWGRDRLLQGIQHSNHVSQRKWKIWNPRNNHHDQQSRHTAPSWENKTVSLCNRSCKSHISLNLTVKYSLRDNHSQSWVSDESVKMVPCMVSDTSLPMSLNAHHERNLQLANAFVISANFPSPMQIGSFISMLLPSTSFEHCK